MKAINTTPHNVVVIKADGETVTYKGGSPLIRVSATTQCIDNVGGIDIYEETLGDPIIDDPEDLLLHYRALIVSRVVADKLKGMSEFDAYELYVPGNLVRDNSGNIVGCKGLIKIR